MLSGRSESQRNARSVPRGHPEDVSRRPGVSERLPEEASRMRVHPASRKYPCISCSSNGYISVKRQDTRRSDALDGGYFRKHMYLLSHRPGHVGGSVLGRSIHRARHGIVEAPHSRVHALKDFHLEHVHLADPVVPAQFKDRATNEPHRTCFLRGGAKASVPPGRTARACSPFQQFRARRSGSNSNDPIACRLQSFSSAPSSE